MYETLTVMVLSQLLWGSAHIIKYPTQLSKDVMMDYKE